MKTDLERKKNKNKKNKIKKTKREKTKKVHHFGPLLVTYCHDLFRAFKSKFE